MPEIRTPDFFTVGYAADTWRFGAFSNPHYTVFVGMSRDALQAEARGTALWFAGGGVIALGIAGLGAWYASGRAVIQSTLNEVLRTDALDDESHQRISVVLHQMSRLKHITQSLLLLSKADAGELPVRRERYDLSDDLEGLMDDAEELCESAGLAFGKSIEPGVFVGADRALMHQVFQNLVSNAVKHNLVNGSVRIRLCREAAGVSFEISNSCAAIPEEVKRRLFDRFYHAENSRSGEGFGLVLNISSELARANGAKLELLPAVSGMICFAVTFPDSTPTGQ